MSAEAPAGTPRRFGLPRANWVVWLFALVGFLGLICVAALVAMLVALQRPYQPAKVAAAGPEPGKETVLTLGRAEEVPGTRLLAFDVSASEGRSSSAYSGGSEDRRNVLLVNRDTGASRKLLPDNQHRLYDSRFLAAQAQSAAAGAGPSDTELLGRDKSTPDGAPAAYFMLEVGAAARPELRDIVVGVLATGRQGAVMRGLDGVDQVWMHSPTQIGLIVRERLGLYYRIVDIPSLAVVRSQRIQLD